MLKAILYEEKYEEQVKVLIDEFFKEAYTDEYIGNVERAGTLLANMRKDGAIYLCIESTSDEVVGFVSVFLYNLNEMIKTNLTIDYIYVKPEYRKTPASMWLYASAGKMAVHYGLSTSGISLVNSATESVAKYLNGKLIMKHYIYSKEDVEKNYKKIMNLLKRHYERRLK